MHVHIVGTGAGGTGCWLAADNFYRRLQARLLLSAIGMPPDSLRGDFDRLYVEHLLAKRRESSLGAVVILAQEQVYDAQGKLIQGAGLFHVPNDYVLQLARKHPEFLPTISIHPARPDALEELDRCLAGGAVMLKILPNVQNIDCSDRRFTKFWERMAAAKLPLLAHTGGEKTLPVVNAELANPRRLELPLQIGVTVIAAHCATKSALFDAQWFPDFVGLTRRYPNLYGDNSAFCVANNRIRGSIVPDTLAEPLAARIVHGSDWPVPVSGLWPRLKGYVSVEEHRCWARHPNLLERDYQLKRAMGYAPETFTRIWRLLRLAANWSDCQE
jgi:predicted TIM-barrel fold metal-dependent hydrolase